MTSDGDAPSGTREGRQQLLNRVFGSRHFASAESLRRVLQYIWDHVESTGVAPKEYDIAVGALGRQASFDPRSDPIVRVDIAQIRERLQAYFEADGQHERLRVAIPKGQYRPVFYESSTPLAPPRAEYAALVRFWAPYIASEAETVVVFSEMLFLRSDTGTFVRNIYVNDLGGARQEMQVRTNIDVAEFTPSYHFVSAGEVHALLALTRMFGEQGRRCDTRNARFSSWAGLGASNLILLGSSRTNTFLDSLQRGGNFVIAADCIENAKPRRGEQPTYRGSRRTDGKLEKLTEYAIVTRGPGVTPGSVITTLAANHGRAIQGAAEFLTTDDRVQALLTSLQLHSQAAFPQHFQLLLRIEMIDFDEEVIEVTCIAHRIDSTAAGEDAADAKP